MSTTPSRRYEVEALRANATTGLTLTGNAYSHTLVGNVGNDTLLGGAGNDALNGGVGADTMAGGAGNDTYFVDNAADVVNETVGQGTDTVMASVNYSLTAGSEIEFLRANAGTTGLSLTGNALVNRLVGGVGNDTLDGGAGNDSLGGGAGNDVFRFLAGFGQDTITDFTAHAGAAGSKDLMDISGLGITAATFAANRSYRKRRRGQHDGHVHRRHRLDPTSQRRRPASIDRPISGSPEVWLIGRQPVAR